MNKISEPVYFKIKENGNFLDKIANEIRNQYKDQACLLLDYPALYVHIWQSKKDKESGKASIYVGETNDIVQRTKEHWSAASVPSYKRSAGNWQWHMKEDLDENDKEVVPTVFFFGHESFHKSLTLDIENRLIDYCYSMSTANIYNGRTNPQGVYSGYNELDFIFSKIWNVLRNEYPEIFLPEADIKDNAFYKASPNHKLTEGQKEAKNRIINRTTDAIINDEVGQLIFVEGEAGTGKTVLATSAFYEILENDLIKSLNAKCCLLINHEEQKTVYINGANKLGYRADIIKNPTGFIIEHSVFNEDNTKAYPNETNIEDVVFIDEAHLLWNQNNQKFDRRFSSHQIDEILERSRVTIMMFDETQMLYKKNYADIAYFNKLRELAKEQGNYIELKNQLRMDCAKDTMNWIDAFTKNKKVKELHLDSSNKDENGYEVVLFDSPKEMHTAIKEKAEKEDSKLSRIVSTMDWYYSNSKAPTEYKYWHIQIGDWMIPWNEEVFWRDIYWPLHNAGKKKEIKKYLNMDWAEKDYSINEAGNTFTIQGFDLTYVGVILGPSVRYDEKTDSIYIDEQYRTQEYMKGSRTMEDGSYVNFTEKISLNEFRVLLTRGRKGLYIYACDDKLREKLKDSIIVKNE